MTITEMHTVIDLLLDKAEAPWYNATEKDRFLNLSQIEFTETRYREFEFNEKRREELLPLVRTFTVTNQGQINLDVVPDFLYVLNVAGYWKDSCLPSGLRLEALKPVSLDKYAESQKDPFNKNDDENPGYLQRNDGTNNLIEVLSTTVAETIELNFLKYPRNVDINTLTDSELPIGTHEELVNIAVRKMMMVVESVNYQAQINEINNQEQ